MGKMETKIYDKTYDNTNLCRLLIVEIKILIEKVNELSFKNYNSYTVNKSVIVIINWIKFEIQAYYSDSTYYTINIWSNWKEIFEIELHRYEIFKKTNCYINDDYNTLRWFKDDIEKYLNK